MEIDSRPAHNAHKAAYSTTASQSESSSRASARVSTWDKLTACIDNNFLSGSSSTKMPPVCFLNRFQNLAKIALQCLCLKNVTECCGQQTLTVRSSGSSSSRVEVTISAQTVSTRPTQHAESWALQCAEWCQRSLMAVRRTRDS